MNCRLKYRRYWSLLYLITGNGKIKQNMYLISYIIYYICIYIYMVWCNYIQFMYVCMCSYDIRFHNFHLDVLSTRRTQPTCCPRSQWSSCNSPVRFWATSGAWPGVGIHRWTSPGTSRLPRAPFVRILFSHCTSGSRYRTCPLCF